MSLVHRTFDASTSLKTAVLLAAALSTYPTFAAPVPPASIVTGDNRAYNTVSLYNEKNYNPNVQPPGANPPAPLYTIADGAQPTKVATTSGNNVSWLTGASTYSGGTTISDGTLYVVNTQALGTGGVSVGEYWSGDYYPAANATLGFYGISTSQPFSNSVSGRGALTVDTTAFVRLSGNNTYSGITTVMAGGGIKILASNAYSRNSSFLVSGTLDVRGVSVSSSGTLTLDNTSAIMADYNSRIHVASASIASGAKVDVGTNFVAGNLIPLIQTTAGFTGTASASNPLTVSTNYYDKATGSQAYVSTPTGYQWTSMITGNTLYLGLQAIPLPGGSGGGSTGGSGGGTTGGGTSGGTGGGTGGGTTGGGTTGGGTSGGTGGTPTAPTPSIALTPQQASVVNAINAANQLTPAHPTSNQDLLNASTALTQIYGQSPAQYQAALNQLMGNNIAGIHQAVFRSFSNRSSGLMQLAGGGNSRSSSLADASPSNDVMSRATCLSDLAKFGDDNRTAFFAYAEHASGSQDAQSNGALNTDTTNNNFTVGGQQSFDDHHLTIGAAFGFDDADTTAGGGIGDMKSKTYGLSVYASYDLLDDRTWFVAGSFGGGYSTYDGTRNLGFASATGSTTGYNFNLMAQTGYRFNVWEGGQLTPFAGLSYLNNAVKGYSESLPAAPGLALSYDDMTNSTTQGFVGVELAQKWELGDEMWLMPSLRMTYFHAFSGSDSRAITTRFVGDTTTPFTSNINGIDKDALQLEAAATLALTNQWKVFVEGRLYQGLESGGAKQHGIGAGASFSF